MKKRITRCIMDIVTILFLIIIVTSMYAMVNKKRNPDYIPSLGPYQIMTVLTGSMTPVFHPGDMIVTKGIDKGSIQVGDIITFNQGDNHLITHRVEDIINENDQVKYQTKGDANSTYDQDFILPHQVIGTYQLRIPKGGYFIEFVQGPLGYVFTFFLPILFLVLGELKILLDEIEKMQQLKSDKIRGGYQIE